jgi:hypothetical protein
MSACASTQVIPSANDHFEGIAALTGGVGPAGVTAEAPTRILIIHGMGTASEHDFDSFIANVADKFGVVQAPQPAEQDDVPCKEKPPGTLIPGLTVPKPELIANAAALPADWARLYVYKFTRPGEQHVVLTIGYLLWTPLTCHLKWTNDIRETGHPARQYAAHWAKDFMRDKLTDVVLYVGAYRDQVIRPSIEAGLCRFIDGSPGPNGACFGGDASTPTAVVTHSLGGYMLMDAINDAAGVHLPDGTLSPDTAGTKLAKATRYVYMMANQLPLLDLSTVETYPTNADAPPPSSAPPSAVPPYNPPPIERSILRFARQLHNAQAAGHEKTMAAAHEIQVVAFSDPNDILSYLVSPDALDTGPSYAYLTNVYRGNGEFSIPLLFSDPEKAHTGYFENRVVLDLLVCGMKNGAVAQPCRTASKP